LLFEGVPQLEDDVEKRQDLDREIKASGFWEEKDQEAISNIHEHYLEKNKEEGEKEDLKEVDEEN